ncbi:MAG: dihydropteroate synthase [Actinobacteria bacterium]|nr:dihydropteroate synthase [Actinomycetota bacterium]
MLRLGDRTFGPGQYVVMAIINRTTDSFYDKGATWSDDAALDRAARLVEQGADMLDIGGVKAAPGAPIDIGEEIRRVAAFVGEVRSRHPEVIISVDTYRAEVARAVAAEGADVLNDAWGGWDPDVAVVAAEAGLGLVCTHAGGLAPRTRPHRVRYDDLMADILSRTVGAAQRAAALGVPADSIMIDPGHDFGMNTRQSLVATGRISELVASGWPVLVSLSNKDFVGEALDRPVGERLIGTLAATAVCAWQGAQVFRVHEAAQTRDVLDMVAAIKGEAAPRLNVRGLA